MIIMDATMNPIIPNIFSAIVSIRGLFSYSLSLLVISQFTVIYNKRYGN